VPGRYLYAIGGNEEAARFSGINTRLIKAVAHVIASTLTAVLGIILSSRVNSGVPTLGAGLELQSIAAVTIGGVSLGGGVGKITWVLFGILFLAIIQNGLNLAAISSYVQLMVTGIVIVLAVFCDMMRRRSVR